MSKGTLYIISGPSGTGKGTICDIVKKDDGNFVSVSLTSREKRPGETEGVTYNYTSAEEFKRLIDEGQMLEWAMYDGNYYGTPRETVQKMLDEGKNVILEIEVQGAAKVKELFPETVMIFVLPPSMAELKRRLIERGREGLDRIATRLETARKEIMLAPRYNYVVVNDDLEDCVSEVREIIRQAELSKNNIHKLLNEKI